MWMSFVWLPSPGCCLEQLIQMQASYLQAHLLYVSSLVQLIRSLTLPTIYTHWEYFLCLFSSEGFVLCLRFSPFKRKASFNSSRISVGDIIPLACTVLILFSNRWIWGSSHRKTLLSMFLRAPYHFALSYN